VFELFPSIKPHYRNLSLLGSCRNIYYGRECTRLVLTTIIHTYADDTGSTAGNRWLDISYLTTQYQLQRLFNVRRNALRELQQNAQKEIVAYFTAQSRHPSMKTKANDETSCISFVCTSSLPNCYTSPPPQIFLI
jgi:hypothetical protein